MNKNVKIARELIRIAKNLIAGMELTMDDVDHQLIEMGFDDEVLSKQDKMECLKRITQTCESYPDLNWEDWIDTMENVLWKKLKERGIEEI